MKPVEITPEDFTEELVKISNPIIERITQFESYPGKFNPEYFRLEWKNWMKLGFARTWTVPGAVLGATFSRQLFTGDMTANIVFWHGVPGCKHAMKLLRAVQDAAKLAGCKVIYSAAYKTLDGDLMKRLYRIKGFRESETVFRSDVR